VTGSAVAFAAEDRESGLLFCGKSTTVAADEAIERGIAREDRAYKTGQCAGNFVRRESHARGSFGERQIHLVGILDRFQDLFFERGDAAVPEK